MALGKDQETPADTQKVTKAGEQNYYKEAGEWEDEKYKSAKKRARIWAWVAGAALSTTFLSVLTLMMVVPLKETVPYVIEVDRVSGIVEVKRPLGKGAISQSEAITKFFIVAYLTAREGYLYDRAENDYVIVQKMSSNEVAANYYEAFNPGNEESPLNVLGRQGRINIEIRNVSFIDKDTVTVPIVRTETRKGQKVERFDVVTLSFKYLNNPASEDDRFINPLGFQVTSYRRDPQLLRNAP